MVCTALHEAQRLHRQQPGHHIRRSLVQQLILQGLDGRYARLTDLRMLLSRDASHNCVCQRGGVRIVRYA
eukprot:12443-Eustigmatos_ZCMA.PRE.1